MVSDSLILYELKKTYFMLVLYFIIIWNGRNGVKILYVLIVHVSLAEVNQSTIPAQLPVVGEPGDDVILTTVFPKGPTLFELDGKRLQLLQPLDRDADNLSHMVFQVA